MKSTSTSTTTSANPLQNAIALKTAKIEGHAHLEELKKAGVIGLTRPVKIIATPLSSETGHDKIVHIIRHGQGFHNLMADIYRKNGIKWKSFSNDLTNNPYALPELLDPPLTEHGRQQAKALGEKTSKTKTQLVVTSPMRRAIQTAMLACPHLYGDGKTRWEANELARETMGVHTCDKRRTITEKSAEFPHINFKSIEEDTDTKWRSDHRETARECSDRCYQLALWIRKQEEEEIIISAHSSVLFSLMNTVFESKADMGLSQWLMTGEMRSMHITFVPKGN